MSVNSEISRLNVAKATIKTAVANKGVKIPATATIDEYSTYINQLPSAEEYAEMQEKLKNMIYLV